MMNKEKFNQGCINESHRAENMNKEIELGIIRYHCFIFMLNNDKGMLLFSYLKYQICSGRKVEPPIFPVFPHPDKYNNDIPPVISSLRFECGSYQKVSEQRNT